MLDLNAGGSGDQSRFSGEGSAGGWYGVGGT
jgi:hypothetical protein